MMRVGVPEFRSRAAMIDREVQDILDLGVELRLTLHRQTDLFLNQGVLGRAGRRRCSRRYQAAVSWR